MLKPPVPCEPCVPPKRHLGCHSHCKEYKDAIDEWERDKQAKKDAQKDDDIYYGYVKRQVKRWEKTRNDH